MSYWKSLPVVLTEPNDTDLCSGCGHVRHRHTIPARFNPGLKCNVERCGCAGGRSFRVAQYTGPQDTISDPVRRIIAQPAPPGEPIEETA